jgi:NAD+ synthase
MMRALEIPLTAEELVTFIKTTVAHAGFSRVVGNVSGGVDSATAAALACAALGPENVFAILLPYRDWHIEATRLARLQLQDLHIPSSNVFEVNIAPMVDAFLNSTNIPLPRSGEKISASELNAIRAGNIMARVRMIMLYDFARKLDALVLGTENQSEYFLGYYTRFGDEASDIEPLRRLYKTELYQLAEHLNVLKEIREAAPTAGLWPGQTDEGQFGFTYKNADKILYGLHEAHASPQELVEQGLDENVIEAVQNWVTEVEFKHHLPWVAPEPKQV